MTHPISWRRPKRHVAKKGDRPEDANQHTAAAKGNESQDLSAELAARYLRLDFFDCGALERLGRVRIWAVETGWPTARDPQLVASITAMVRNVSRKAR